MYSKKIQLYETVRFDEAIYVNLFCMITKYRQQGDYSYIYLVFTEINLYINQNRNTIQVALFFHSLVTFMI